MAIFRFPSSWRDLAIPQFTKEMVARLEDRDQALEDYLTNVQGTTGGGTGGGVLAYLHVNPPGSYYAQTISEVGLDSIDTGVLTVSFTVPDSGNVLVEMEGFMYPTAYDDIVASLYFGLFNTDTSAIDAAGLVIGYSNLISDTGSPIQGRRVSCSLVVEGLTPGDTVTYDWAAQVILLAAVGGAGSDLYIVAGDYTGPLPAGPLTMTVTSLP